MARNPSDLINNFSQIGTTPTEGSSTNKPKKNTQFWVNVGLQRPDGKGGTKLVQLPMGIPLDELVAPTVPSPKTQNIEFRNLRLAQNQLWAEMKRIMETLKPGESVTLPLQVELRKVDEKEIVENVDQSENPFAIGDLKLV